MQRTLKALTTTAFSFFDAISKYDLTKQIIKHIIYL